MSLNDYLSFAASAAEALERAVARDQQAVELVATPEAERQWAVQRHQRREAGRHTRRVWTRQDKRWQVVHERGGVVPQRRADRVRHRVREVDWRSFAWARQEAVGLALVDQVEALKAAITDMLESRDEHVQRTCDHVRQCVLAVLERLPAEAGEQITEPPQADMGGDLQHSELCDWVRWNGTDYTFAGMQAACVRVLVTARTQGRPHVPSAELLEAAESASTKVSDLFKAHEAWNTLIVSPKRGLYCLATEKK